MYAAQQRSAPFTNKKINSNKTPEKQCFCGLQAPAIAPAAIFCAQSRKFSQFRQSILKILCILGCVNGMTVALVAELNPQLIFRRR
ncbi:MAG: hypothetical protein O7F73_18330, partial [Gammaproteobacteria bacterium]|nr:hypothetical protein [Gammaproteobacteria bacterium]